MIRPLVIRSAVREPSSMESEVAAQATTFHLGQTVEVEPKWIGEMACACWGCAADIVDKFIPEWMQSSQKKIYI